MELLALYATPHVQSALLLKIEYHLLRVKDDKHITNSALCDNSILMKC